MGPLIQPVLEDEEPDHHHDWIPIRKRGLELGFADAAQFAGRPRGLSLCFEKASELKAATKPAGLVFGAVKFYRARDLEARQYSGALPFGLQVLYSTIENHLFRITLMAPGYWQDLADVG